MPSHTSRIAIIGGGPAGALAAEHLARAGRRVVLFEERPDWEKPCGGGITPKALLRYPWLGDAAIDHNLIESCELISPAGRRVSFELDQKIAVFSRRILNRFMLERARFAGAEICYDRVSQIEGTPGRWRLRTRDGVELQANFIVIATGARNPFRAQFSRPFRPNEVMVALGYYIPGTNRRIQVRFLPGLDGYIWVFPRSDHFSAGICGKAAGGKTSAQLRQALEEFLDQEGLDRHTGQLYSHVLPSPDAATLQPSWFCGEGWAMVGDAAGFVDPITGEGLYYAFRSAELLAEALTADQPSAYKTLLAQDILPELVAASHYADHFFHGTLLGQPVLERMVQFIEESIRFRVLIADLFAGAQAYVTLRGRCYRQVLPVLWNVMATG